MTLTQERIKPSHHQIRVLKERCKECGFCIEFCPQKAISKSAEINSHGYHIVGLDNSDKCTGCNICAMICPEFAITLVPTREEPKKRR
ncbi:4Fe-4S dicluster domain-containing protein [Chloroflexota bacterium]